MSILFLLSGLYMGWSLGANDPSHIFGTAVVTNMIKYRTVIILLCIFLCLGAALQGAEGLSTLKSIASQTEMSAFVAAFIAASTVLLMVKFNLPASTSQAMLGAIIGIGFVNCNANLSRVPAIMASWVLTPAGCAVISMILYPIFSAILKKAKLSDKKYDRILKAVVIISGCYGSYSLGANNLANVTGVYYGTLLTLNQAIWIGAISICLGVITYSKVVTDKVMLETSVTKTFYIVTDKEKEISQYIVDNLGYGVTVLDARGGYTNDKKKVLMCAIPTRQYYLLKEVIKGLKDVRARGNVDVEIEGVEKDSRNIKKNYLFVAIKGFDSDGHSFIEKAISTFSPSFSLILTVRRTKPSSVNFTALFAKFINT